MIRTRLRDDYINFNQDPLYQDLVNKNRIRTSLESNLSTKQKQKAYQIYNRYDIILSIISAICIISTITYLFCASENIIHQSTDTEILITLVCLLLSLAILPITELIICKITIDKVKNNR